MAEKNESQNSSILDEYLNNIHWFIGSVLFFFLALTIYFIFTPASYKLQTTIKLPENSRPAELFVDDIKSRDLVKKAIEQLHFEVSYYHRGFFKKTELYGDSLPIKFIFPVHNAVESSVQVEAHIVDDQLFKIDQNDTVIHFFFNKPAVYSFAKFKGMKGPAFRPNDDNTIVLKFTQPDELLEEYFKNLKVRLPNAESRTITLSFVTSTPKKGIDFLNKLVEVYNVSVDKGAVKTGLVATDKADLQKATSHLAALKSKLKRFDDRKAHLPVIVTKTNVTKIDKPEQKMQLKILEAIQPYARSSVNQFVQIPDGYEVNDHTLKDLITLFNKAELDKQRALQDSQANKNKIISFNQQIAGLKVSILQKIDINKKDISGNTRAPISTSSSSPLLVSLNDSISKINRFIKAEQDELNANRNTTPIAATTNQALTIIDKPVNNITDYPNKVWAYFIALILGIMSPLVLSYFKYLSFPVNIAAFFRKWNAKLYELTHAKEID